MAEQIVASQDEPPQPPEETQSNPLRSLRRKVSGRVSDSVRGRVPYTKAFQRRMAESQDSLSMARLTKYEQITSIHDDVKHSLSRQFEAIARGLSEVEAWISMIRFYVGMIFSVIFVLFMIVMPPLVATFFPQLGGWGVRGFWWSALEFFSRLITVYLAFAIIGAPSTLALGIGEKAKDFFNINRLYILWVAVLLVMAGGYLYALYTGRAAAWPSFFRHRFFFYCLIQAGFLVPTVVALLMPFALLVRWLERRKKGARMRAFIIDELLEILHRFDNPEYDLVWTSLLHRKWLTQRLENISSCIENHFPQYFITGVPEMDRWATLTASEMANGVRTTIKWVVAPTGNTREEFKARIAKYFIAALSSEWGKFDRVAAEKLSRKESLRARAVSVATALLTAAVPVLLLILLRRLQLVDEPLLTYLTVGAYIWAALSILSHLDPDYNTKLGALKDLTKTLPFGNRGGD